MSNQTLQFFPPFQVQCRVTLDNVFRCSRSIVEPRSTALSAVPGQCQVTLDNVFRCSRSNVEPSSTALSAVTGPMSSHARQHFRCSSSNVGSRLTALPAFAVKCRVTLHSTSVVPVPMSSHVRQRFPLYQVQCRAHIDVLFYIVLF